MAYEGESDPVILQQAKKSKILELILYNAGHAASVLDDIVSGGNEDNWAIVTPTRAYPRQLTVALYLMNTAYYCGGDCKHGTTLADLLVKKMTKVAKEHLAGPPAATMEDFFLNVDSLCYVIQHKLCEQSNCDTVRRHGQHSRG